MFFQRKKISFILEVLILSTIVGIVVPAVFILKGITQNQPIPWQYAFTSFLYSFIVTFCIYFFNIEIARKFQQREHWFPSQFVRIFTEFLITTITSSILISLIWMAYMRIIHTDSQIAVQELFDNILVAIIINSLFVMIVESVFFFKKWKNSLVEFEQLKRRNIEIQYAALASQVNPHFLFNSLNALSSLIKADPEKAIVFTREFSKIYRYVLDSKDKLIVALEEELNFLYSFLYLQKIRYGNNLEYTVEIEGGCLDLFLPPLSLQLLVENAIKHNEISEENPLHIQITAKEQRIWVTNNYRPIRKTSRSESGIGLKNLIERYAHYTDIIPEFQVENQTYVAKIPLLKDE